MKKVFLLCLAMGTALSLAACSVNSSSSESGSSSSDISSFSESSSSSEISSVEIEEGTSQEWIDLFTFTNVTISIQHSLTILDDMEYRCVDSKWYVKGEHDTEFVEFNEDPATIYQIAYAHYSKFTYDENYYYYKAEKMKIDDSQFAYSVTVMLDPNSVERRIGWIYSNAFISDSLDTTTTMEFKNYGETTLD